MSEMDNENARDRCRMGFAQTESAAMALRPPDGGESDQASAIESLLEAVKQFGHVVAWPVERRGET